MKRTMKLLVAGLAMVSLASCAKANNKGIGKEVIKFSSQLDALNQLNKGTVDVAIIDSVMAGYYTNNGELKEKLQIVEGLSFAEEQYGIAGRKNDKNFINLINETLVAIKDTDAVEVGNYFGLTSELAIPSSFTKVESTDTSVESIVASGKIIVGYTVFAPIAYTDTGATYANNQFTGFDIELARKVVNKINTTYNYNLALEFVEIDWNTKETSLENGTIDLIWNGLTITDERKANMTISVPYLNNKQVAVIAKEDAKKFTDKASLKKAVIGVESGSYGEEIALGK